jgi:hypothetical protein
MIYHNSGIYKNSLVMNQLDTTRWADNYNNIFIIKKKNETTGSDEYFVSERLSGNCHYNWSSYPSFELAELLAVRLALGSCSLVSGEAYKFKISQHDETCSKQGHPEDVSYLDLVNQG